MVLYGCETWSLTVREEHRLRVFEQRVLRRIFGPRRDEVTGDWRKLHNEELHNLYSSPKNMPHICNSKNCGGFSCGTLIFTSPNPGVARNTIFGNTGLIHNVIMNSESRTYFTV
jgi:hypothetical protein